MEEAIAKANHHSNLQKIRGAASLTVPFCSTDNLVFPSPSTLAVGF